MQLSTTNERDFEWVNRKGWRKKINLLQAQKDVKNIKNLYINKIYNKVTCFKKAV